MPVLRSSPPSPFGRKAKIAAAVLGLKDRIAVEMTDTTDPSDTIRAQNPLGKIPALVLDDGRVLFDSRVVVEYLDHLAGGGKIIPAGAARFDVLRLAAPCRRHHGCRHPAGLRGPVPPRGQTSSRTGWPIRARR